MGHMIRNSLLLALALASVASQSRAQTVAAGARGGTFGLGGEVVLGLGHRLGLRAGIGLLPFTPRGTISGISYDIEPPSPLSSVNVDLYLLDNLRLIGGFLFGAEHTDFDARLAESVRVGDRTYTPQQIGSLAGTVESRSAAPFAGLGFGRYGDGRVGVTLDLGVAFMGENDLILNAAGPISGDATFQQELEKERASVEEDLRKYTRLLPVLNLGLHVVL
jgi:hypothetical protein